MGNDDACVPCGRGIVTGRLVGVATAYPRVDMAVLRRYRQDDICGTWELLADAVHRGGAAAALKRAGWQAVGREKAAWAERIGRHVDPCRNGSPSFQYFRKQVRVLAQ